MAIPAAIAAYEEGHNWLRELKQVLRDNFAYAREFLAKEVPEVKVLDSNLASDITKSLCNYLLRQSYPISIL
ncbi:MAG: hypothetical protein SOH91_01855 [Lactobacillus delbrueckii]